MGKDEKARDNLIAMKNAIVDYASLQDALNLMGARPAFLVQVGPTPEDHEMVREKLVSRYDTPVFVSRPLPELFDAVDPSSDTGGGLAEYTLTLDLPCYFRQVSTKDRVNIAFADNKGNLPRMKWLEHKRNQKIIWRPISLTDTDGGTVPYSSFDIAVVQGDKVVVFRNQNLITGDSENQVRMQLRTYIANVLKLPSPENLAMFNITQIKSQYFGALQYSPLSEPLLGKNDSRVVDVRTLEAFQNARMADDRKIDQVLEK
jgi:hypothetical protein